MPWEPFWVQTRQSQMFLQSSNVLFPSPGTVPKRIKLLLGNSRWYNGIWETGASSEMGGQQAGNCKGHNTSLTASSFLLVAFLPLWRHTQTVPKITTHQTKIKIRWIRKSDTENRPKYTNLCKHSNKDFYFISRHAPWIFLLFCKINNKSTITIKL